jgi:hypothetical protein
MRLLPVLFLIAFLPSISAQQVVVRNTLEGYWQGAIIKDGSIGNASPIPMTAESLNSMHCCSMQGNSRASIKTV